jgi:hypothetical protein
LLERVAHPFEQPAPRKRVLEFLNRTAMARQTRTDEVGRTREGQPHEPGVPQNVLAGRIHVARVDREHAHADGAQFSV